MKVSDLTKRIAQGDEEAIKAYNTIMATLPKEERKKFQDIFLEEYLRYHGVLGLSQDKLTSRAYKKLVNAIMHFPSANQEQAMKLILNKLKIAPTPTFVKELTEEVEEQRRFDERWNKMRTLGISMLPLGLLLRRIPSPNKFLDLASKALAGVAGVAGTADIYRQTIVDSPFTLDRMQTLDMMLNVLGIAGGLWGLFSRGTNPFFKPATLEQNIIENLPLSQRTVEITKQLPNIFAKILKDENNISMFQPIATTLDSLAQGELLLVARHHTQNVDKITKIRHMLTDEFITKLIRKEPLTPEEQQNLNAIRKQINLSTLEKLLIHDIDKVVLKTPTETFETTPNLPQIFSYIENATDDVEVILMRNNQIVKRQVFSKDYIPTFTSATIIRAKKDEIIKHVYADEIDLAEKLKELEDQGWTILRIFLPSYKKIQTSKFAKTVAEKIKDLVEEGDLTKLEDEIREIIRDGLQEVWTYAKTSELGFIQKALDEKGEELAKNLLRINFITKSANSIPINTLRELLAKTKISTPRITKLRALIDYISDPPEFPTTKINQAFRKLFLMFNLPVTIQNALLNPLFISATSLANKNKLNLFPKFAFSFLKNASLKDGLTEIKKILEENPKLTIAEILTIPNAFFRFIVTAYKKTLKERAEGKTFAEWIFNISDVPDDLLNTFLYSEGILAHPSFFAQKIQKIPLNIINEFSAFFVANYVPYYYALKNTMSAALQSILGKSGKNIAPLLAITGTTATIGTLIGLRQTPIVNMFENAIQFGDVLANLFLKTEDENPLLDTIYTFAADEAEKLSNLLTFALLSTTDETLPAIFTHIALGRGLIGFLTGWRTEAAAMTLPSLLDSPAVQLITTYPRIYYELKKKFPEESDPLIIQNALVRTIYNNMGIFKKLSETLIGRITNIAHYDPPHFSAALKNIFLPAAPIEKPTYFSLLDDRQITITREQGIVGLQYLFSSLQKLKTTGGKTHLLDNINKAIERYIEKRQKDEPVNPHNLAYILLLKYYIQDKEPNEDKITEILQKVTHISEVQAKALVADYNKKFKIARRLHMK